MFEVEAAIVVEDVGESVPDGEFVPDVVWVDEGVIVGVSDEVIDPESEPEGVGVCVAEGVPVEVTEAEGVSVLEGVSDEEWVVDAVPVPEPVGVPDGESEPVGVAETETEPESEPVEDALAARVIDDVGDSETDAVSVVVEEDVPEPVPVGVWVGDGVLVPLGEIVVVAESDPEFEGVLDALTPRVCELVGELENERDSVLVDDGVTSGVPEGDSEEVPVGVPVSVPEGVGVPDGVEGADIVLELDEDGIIEIEGGGDTVNAEEGVGLAGQPAIPTVKYCDSSSPRPSAPTAMTTSAEPTRAEQAATGI